jgi:hypothetical protein
MRFRSIVLPTAVALAAVVAVPSSANAAVQCGLTVPSKVVVNSPHNYGGSVRLTSGCDGADHAYWDYVHNTTAFPMDFTAGHIDGTRSRPFVADFTRIGRWVLTPRGAEQPDGTPLTQNTAVTYVKYHSEIDARVSRTSTKLILNATATRYDGGGDDEYIARPGVTVGLFHRTSSAAAWTYVKSATTSGAGTVTLSVTSPKSGDYRLAVAETPTVWASYSYTVPGRV